MPEVAWLLLSFLATLVGMAWLALAMDNHWRHVREDSLSPSRRRSLRLFGSVALAASLLTSFAANHASMAPLVWIMEIGVASVLVAFLLAFRPRTLAVLAPRGAA